MNEQQIKILIDTSNSLKSGALQNSSLSEAMDIAVHLAKVGYQTDQESILHGIETGIIGRIYDMENRAKTAESTVADLTDKLTTLTTEKDTLEKNLLDQLSAEQASHTLDVENLNTTITELRQQIVDLTPIQI
jgi:hypothetical protein